MKLTPMQLEDYLIYLASPYSDPNADIRNTRYQQACKTASILFKKGLFIFSPIAHSHNIAYLGGIHSGFSAWRDFDFKMLEVCSVFCILTLSGWEKSKGIKEELSFANMKGYPIIFSDIHGNLATYAQELEPQSI